MGGGSKGGGGKGGGGGNKSKKTLNKVQQRFKQREAAGLSGLTGLKKGTEKKGKNSTLGIYRQYQSDSIRGRAGNQEAAARAAERDREVAEIKANTRAKNLASGTDLGVTTQQNVNQQNVGQTLSSTFTNPALQNFGQTSDALNYAKGLNLFSTAQLVAPGRDLGSWYNQGSDPTKSLRQLISDEKTMRQRTQGVNKGWWNPARGMPGYGTVKNILTGKPWNTPHEGGFESGPTESNRRLFNNLTKAQIATTLFKQGQTGSVTDQIANQTIGKINPYAGTAGTDKFSTEAAAARLRGPRMNLFGVSLPEFGVSEYMGLNTADRNKPTGLNIGNVEAGAASEEGRNTRSLKSKALGVLDSFTSDAFDFDGLGRDKMPDSMKGVVNIAGALQQNPIRQTMDAYNALQNLNQKATPGDSVAIKNQMKILTQNLGNPDSPLAPINQGWKAFTTDDPNIKGFGEFGQDLRDTFTPGSPGISPREIGGKGSTLIEKFGKNLIAKNLTNIVTEGDKSAGIEAGSTRNIRDLYNLSQRIRENVKDPLSISGKAAGNIAALTGQGTKAPTIRTILSSRGGGNRVGGSLTQAGGSQPLPLPILEEKPTPTPQTGTDNRELQNLQQQSYLNTLMMIQNDPRFRYARGTPRSFSRSFNRRFF